MTDAGVGGAVRRPPAVWATKRDVAYRVVRDRIMGGLLGPGAEIDQERLARELGLSSTPLREALRQLEAEGLLKQIAHRKMRVSELSRRELEEIYDLRLVLDPFGAQLGAASATDQERERIKELLANLHPLGASYLDELARNYELHRAMYVASRNTVLIESLDQLWDRFDRYRVVLIREGMTADSADAEHLAIVTAFCSGDGRQVAKLVREHLSAGRDALLKRWRREGLRNAEA